MQNPDNLRPGFTLLEAAVAMMIIGVASVGTLGAFAADLRAADRAQRILPAAALAADRLSALEIAGSSVHSLPDSLARGRFAAPFAAYSWTASVASVRSTPALMELRTDIYWDGGSFNLTERRYAPSLVRARSVR